MLVSENVVGNVFSQTTLPSLIVDADTFEVSWLNAACEKLLIQAGSNTVELSQSELHKVSAFRALLPQLRKSAETNQPRTVSELHLSTASAESEIVCNIHVIPFLQHETQRMLLVLFNDITPYIRSRHDAELRDSDFRNLIMEAPVGMAVLTGEDLVIESANSAMLALWGRDEEVIGKAMHDAMPELVLQPFKRILADVLNTGEPFYGYEFPGNLLRNGVLEDCYFNFIYSPVRRSNGEADKVMVIAYEVTVQVKAKRQLENSEKRFRNLVEQSLVATAIYVGEEMRIELANDAMLRLWGKDSSVIGKTLREALPELDGQPFHELLANVYKTGVTYAGREDRADLVVDGTLQSFFFNFTYKALTDVNGQVYAILNMAIDITDQVRAKKRIQESQDRLSQAVISADLGTFEFEYHNSQMHYTRRMAEIFGLDTQEKLTHADFTSAIHLDDLLIRSLAHARAAKTGELFYEVRVIHPDNTIRWIRLNGGVKFDRFNVPSRIFGTVMDITAAKTEEETLRKSEEQLRILAQQLEERVQERTTALREANAELVRSNQELEQFAFVTSHDLQEPLRKVRTFANLLSDKNGHLLDQKGKLYLDKINASSTRMSELISSLLNFSRLMNSEERMQPVDLNDVLLNVLSDFELLIRQKNALIEYDDLPPIKANPLQMNQLFFNLVINSLKFTKIGTPAEIRISWKEISGAVAAARFGLANNLTYLKISFADNGIGFEQQYANKIFDIFQRLNDRSAYEGTGIGLALCKKIVNNHAGHIYAEGMLGVGAKFHVILPVF